MRVLVVDDEVRLAEGIRLGLEAEGCAVDVAHDGVDGLWFATEHPYDVIVLDWMMPRMNGWKMLASLRAADDWTPVLMLTARDADQDEIEALGTGADDYVTKPFSFAVLMARLRVLARRGAVARPAQLEVGDLALDPGAHTVRRGDVNIETTSREFAVLEFLMRHRDLVVSKLDVLDGVWDEAFDGDPNIVEVYVGHLRRKVDRPFDRASIQTVRGAGYRLVDDRS
ncbi:MAG TPA: response regulator transcription factor [Aeromicrobium sp.]|nr:response regulator transcription factor [Aeromicrobium sp.]